MADKAGQSPAHIANPISDAELERQLDRGNLLAYERASDAQLNGQRESVRRQIQNSEITRDDYIRYVGMNALYAGLSFGASLWFGIQNGLNAFPKFARSLADFKVPVLAPNGFLREAKTLVPFVADVGGFYAKIADLASEWALIKHGGGSQAATEVGAKKLAVLQKLCDLLKDYGFKGGVDFIESHLKDMEGNLVEMSRFKLSDFIQALEKDVAMKDQLAERDFTKSLAQKSLELFQRAEEIASRGKKGLMSLGDSVKSSVEEILTTEFDVKKVSERITRQRVVPVVGAAALVGAGVVGVLSLRAAKERRSIMNATDLSYIERVQRERDHQQHGQEETQMPTSRIEASTTEHEVLEGKLQAVAPAL